MVQARAANAAADTMNVPRAPASIRYSGQWSGRRAGCHGRVRCVATMPEVSPKPSVARAASKQRHHIRRRRGPHGRRTRLDEPAGNGWKTWGPYLSERQWGTVREDYSPGGTAWEAFSHDAARSRAYRWGEDGLLGISDDQQILCFALALWNGRDPILKERLFGLTNSEGNHGEDVKECYYYLDATPTHSYLKVLYKYPQRAYPYAQLVEENRRRGKDDPEFELIDTGVFDEQPLLRRRHRIREGRRRRTSCIRITVHNRGPETADRARAAAAVVPQHLVVGISRSQARAGAGRRRRRGAERRRWAPTGSIATATRRGCSPRTRPTAVGCSACRRPSGHFKDAFHECVVDGNAWRGQSAAARHQGRRALSPRGSRRAGTASIRLRLSADAHAQPFAGFDAHGRPARGGGRRLLRPAAARRCPTISGWSSGRRWPA